MQTMPTPFQQSTRQFRPKARVGLQLPPTAKCVDLTLHTLEKFYAQRAPLRIASRATHIQPKCFFTMMPPLKLGTISLRVPVVGVSGNVTARASAREVKPCAQASATPANRDMESCPFCNSVPVLQLVTLLCGHGKVCHSCLGDWAATWIGKKKAIRCIHQPQKCGQRLTSRFLRQKNIVPEEIIVKYEEIEGKDSILSLVSSGKAYKCLCGTVYERHGGFCVTGVCDQCNTAFCFNCQQTLRMIGALKHAEAHICPMEAPRIVKRE
eukprot:GEMP01031476.1.p1 GENE.GEMP01031476.1~~GEMP01031476.1.p1  ORF type:complete len:267 (+),score=64.95 GEMP01031476.1:156-956(+)